MEIDGMPLHPLVNDGAVALVPLSVLLAWAFALLPSWRWLSRWAALLATLGGVGALLLTWLTGRDLLDGLLPNIPEDQPLYETLTTHQDRANLLMVVYLVFAVLVVLAFLLLPAPSHLDDGRMAFAGSQARWAATVIPAAVVLVGLAALVCVALVGHAGAQAVWGQ